MLAPSILDFQNSAPQSTGIEQQRSDSVLEMVEKESAACPGSRSWLRSLLGLWVFTGVFWLPWPVWEGSSLVLQGDTSHHSQLEIKESSVHSHNCSGPCYKSGDFVEVGISVEVVFHCRSSDLGIGDFGSSSWGCAEHWWICLGKVVQTPVPLIFYISWLDTRIIWLFPAVESPSEFVSEEFE